MGRPSAYEKVRKKYKNADFKYGQFDCCVFTKEALEAYHSIKVLYFAPYEGKTSDIKANFKESGTRTLKDFLKKVAKLNGWKLVHKKSYLQSFDFCIVKTEKRYLAGIWDGVNVVCAGVDGLQYLPHDSISWAYRVGV